MYYATYAEWAEAKAKSKAIKATLPPSSSFNGHIEKLETAHAYGAGLKKAWTAKSKNYTMNGVSQK